MQNDEQIMCLPTSEIILFWFGGIDNISMKQDWFNSEYDYTIITKYKYWVDNYNIIEWQSQTLTNIDKFVCIIIGDQFTRNIYRNTLEEKKNDNKCLELALELISIDYDLEIPLNWRFFILLPLRHSKTSKLLNMVCDRIMMYKEYHTCKTLIKFYNYTICDYTDMTDEIKIGEPIEYKDTFEQVLEQNKENYMNLIQLSCNLSNVAISLSGGVDSMVLCDLIKKNNPSGTTVAIHVEHADSQLEREFLEYYCHKNNVKLYYRTIHYAKRKENVNIAVDRNIFEEETKKARFKLYKYVMEKEKLDGVCLGHHKGDIVENVFTNMIKGRSSDLMVMKMNQEILGVELFRPLLQYTKDQIYSYAHENNIPYFLNTTPIWSCRGVLRDQVMPILKKQFGDFENNIIKFAESYNLIVENSKHVSYQRKDYEYGVVIDSIDNNKDNLKTLVISIMHNSGYHMISNKSLDSLYKWLQTDKMSQVFISKDMFCYYGHQSKKLYFINYTLLQNSKNRLAVLYEMFGNDKLPPKILEILKKI